MNKSVLLFLFILLPFVANSQVDKKYLTGAVPEIDGKVVFTKTMTTVTDMSADEIFDVMDKWVKENYNDEDANGNRILLSDRNKKQIGCRGVKKLVFQDALLSYDSSDMTYQLLFEMSQNKCDVTIRGIKYEYPNEKGKKEFYPAEEMITDKYALKGEKLNRFYDKFRIHTVDSINTLFSSIDLYLNGKNAVDNNISSATYDVGVVDASPVQVQDRPTDPFPFKKTTADKIPGNIIKLLNEWTLIVSGKGEKMNVMTASWGGLGKFWEKPVSICFLNPTRYSVTTMDEGEVYTISFYTEAYKDAMQYCGSVSGRTTDKIKGSGLTPIKLPSGATVFSEAWMVLECRKIVAQQISPDAVVDKASLKDDWSKNGYHKMYIGEILNVWIK